MSVTAPPVDRWTAGQRRAIEATGRTLVVAAAGSGKTSVLVERVVRALVSGDVSASELLAVTFTDKAAQEMRRRIASSLVAAGRLDLVGELEFAAIGTIHAMCTRILRRHGAAVGIDPGFAVLDEAQSRWISDEAARSALRAHERTPAVHALRSVLSDDAIVGRLLELERLDATRPPGATLEFEGASGTGSAPVDHPDTVTPAVARRQRDATEQLWRSFLRERDARRRLLGRLGFDDLERCAARALERADVRAAVRGMWTTVLVDEFQDTNELQFQLVDAIAGERLFAVGDEWQSIYRFRGADIEVFRRVRSGGDVELVPMRDNFRSAGPILDVVNAVFGDERCFGVQYDPVDVGTPRQRAVAAPCVELLLVPATDHAPRPAPADGGTARQREAARVAARIAELRSQDGVRARDVAVLYPSHAAGEVYEAALEALGIATVRGAGDGFYDHRDIRDVLAVLRVVRNRLDERALVELLAGPLGALEWDELATLVAAAREDDASLWDVLTAAPAVPTRPAAIERCTALVAEVETRAARGSLVDAVAHVCTLPEFELGVVVSGGRDGAARLANLRRLVELAGSAADVGVDDVGGFLEFVDAQRRHARVGEASIADEDVDAVRLLTVHASKGLEFPHTFVVDLAARPRSTGAAAMWGLGGEVVLPVVPPGGRAVAGPVLAGLAAADAELDAGEALRRWYVAFTRAEERLYLSAAYDLRPKADKRGSPRARGGALRWLLPMLGFEEANPEVDTVSTVGDGRVLLDTRPAPFAAPVADDGAGVEVSFARQVSAPWLAEPNGEPEHETEAEATERRARLAAMLASRVGELAGDDDDWRTMQGTRLHDAVARELSSWVAGAPAPHWPDAVRTRIDALTRTPVWRRLVALRARAEVPFVAGERIPDDERLAQPGRVAATSVSVGRIDALAIEADGAWWVVDWKTTLPDGGAEELWRAHGPQLARYAGAARAAGAPGCRVTLVSLHDPTHTHTWSLGSAGEPTLEP